MASKTLVAPFTSTSSPISSRIPSCLAIILASTNSAIACPTPISQSQCIILSTLLTLLKGCLPRLLNHLLLLSTFNLIFHAKHPMVLCHHMRTLPTSSRTCTTPTLQAPSHLGQPLEETPILPSLLPRCSDLPHKHLPLHRHPLLSPLSLLNSRPHLDRARQPHLGARTSLPSTCSGSSNIHLYLHLILLLLLFPQLLSLLLRVIPGKPHPLDHHITQQYYWLHLSYTLSRAPKMLDNPQYNVSVWQIPILISIITLKRKSRRLIRCLWAKRKIINNGVLLYPPVFR